MSKLVYMSTLNQDHRDALEQILFFNANQSRSSAAVELVAKLYGVPRIQLVGDRLSVDLASTTQSQTLFAVMRKGAVDHPAGVAVFTREDDAFVVLFVAVHEKFSSRGKQAKARVLMHMTNEVKAIARRVKGVSCLRVYLGRPEPIRLRVDK
ncbi:MAG: hypothetical protein AAF799_34550 [Myxococcota bacterium]